MCPHDTIDMSFEPHPDSTADTQWHNPQIEETSSLNNVRNTFEWDEGEHPKAGHNGQPTKNKYTIPEDGDPWENCYRKVKEYDDELVKGWRDQVDKLLIFASLLAATVTSFVIDSWKNLQEDPIDKTNRILEQLLLEVRNTNIGNVTALPTPQPFIPSTSDVRLNTFWFMSLSLSLATVLIGIICSQWLREYQRYTRLPPLDGMSVRQLRYEGLFAWKVPNIVMSLPVLLQFSLVLFFVGLLDQLWNLNSLVAAFATIIIGLALVFVIVTTLLPSYQLYFNNDLRSPLCPYKSPQAWVIHRWITRVCRLINTTPRTERDATFFNDKTWLNADLSWYTIKKQLDHTNVHNDTVRALVWIDKQLENSLNMVFSIYHCIRNLLPEESAQVVSQINHRVPGHPGNTLAGHYTTTIYCRDTNLMLYLEAKCQIFPQLRKYHLDSVIRLLRARLKTISHKQGPPPSIPWTLYDISGMPEDLITQFLLCTKELILLEKPRKENMDVLWHLIQITTKNSEPTHQSVRHRQIACEIILAMEINLPKPESTLHGIPDPGDTDTEVKYWTSHVIDLFKGRATQDLQSCCKLVIETLNRRIKDLGGPSIVLSPEEQAVWKLIALSVSSGPVTEDKTKTISAAASSVAASR